MQLLLKKGAKVNQKNMNGGTALSQAVVARHSSAVKMLIGNGADVNAKESSGMSVLTQAYFKKQCLLT
jgi:ankyrin repeat protein